MKTTLVLTPFSLCVVMAFCCQNINTKNDFVKFTVNNYSDDPSKQKEKFDKTSIKIKKTNESIKFKNVPREPTSIFDEIFENFLFEMIVVVLIGTITIIALYVIFSPRQIIVNS